MSGEGYQTYRRAEILSSSAEQLVPLLYRELVRQLLIGKDAIEQRDLERKADAMSRAQAIVLELLASLDVARGGELGHRLASLYRYFLDELEAASRHLDAPRVQALVELIQPLAEAWAQAAEQVAGPAGVGAL